MNIWFKRIALALTLAQGAFACDSHVRDENVATSRFALAPAISTDATVYAIGTPITVTFASLPGGARDWIAIAPEGAGLSTYARWVYTGAATDGNTTFANMPSGRYVARAFANDVYDLLSESAAFTVTAANISTDKTTYAPTENVSVTFAGPGGSRDWISIAPPGSAANAYVRWSYTGGAANGVVALPLTGLTGSYVARLHFADGLTIDAETAPFTVSAAIARTLQTDQASYAGGDSVAIAYAGALGNASDWIAIAPQGAAANNFVTWAYTTGATAATQVLTLPAGMASGSYVARFFDRDSFVIASESTAFTFDRSSGILPDHAAYAPTDSAVISFSGVASSSSTDWIAIAAAGSDDAQYASWAYTDGSATGTVTLPLAGLASGQYVARLFLKDGLKSSRETLPFWVSTTAASLSNDKSSYANSDTLVVSFDGMLGTSADWISIAIAGSAPASYLDWTYTNGSVTGSVSFSLAAIGPGTYVTRAYFADETTLEAESAPFTITP